MTAEAAACYRRHRPAGPTTDLAKGAGGGPDGWALETPIVGRTAVRFRCGQVRQGAQDNWMGSPRPDRHISDRRSG
jgi:hypothetical protein